MSGRPSDVIPFWSENANYPAGTDPWSATPTVVAPSVAVRNAGHVPAAQVPAQYENATKRSLARYVDYLADIAFQNLTPPNGTDSNSVAIALTYNGQSAPMAFWDDFRQAWVVLGHNTAGKYYTGDANSLTLMTIGASKWAVGCLGSGKTVLVCGDVAATIPYQVLASDLSASSNGNLPGTAAGSFAVHALCTNTGRFIIVGTEDGVKLTIWKSDNQGTTWTKVTVFATGPGTTADWRIVQGRNQQLVLQGAGVIGGVYYYSNDNGDTWTQVIPGGGLAAVTRIAYIDYSSEEDTYAMCDGTDFWFCQGDITNGFVKQAMAGITGGAAISNFAFFGAALYFQVQHFTSVNVGWLSWNLGVNARQVHSMPREFGGVVFGGVGTRLYKSDHGALWTDISFVQQNLRCSGLGAVARNE